LPQQNSNVIFRLCVQHGCRNHSSMEMTCMVDPTLMRIVVMDTITIRHW